MLFSVLKRDARANAYVLTSSGAVAALSRLRQQSFPSLPEIPYFSPKTRMAVAPPTWLGAIARQAFYAAVVAGLVLTAAITVPTVLTLRGGDSAPTATALHSSIGTTASANTFVEDLNLGSFIGRVPYVQQLNYYGAASTAPTAQSFVLGARQAEVASYVSDVGEQVTLRYLSNAVETSKAVGLWKQKTDEAAAAEKAAAVAAAGRSSSIAWQASSIAPGTQLSSRITFYNCNESGFCGNMASGVPVSNGYVACSYNLPFGTRFRIENDPAGRIWTCADRGALSATWIDVWFYSGSEGRAFVGAVGSYSTITIVA